MPKFMQGYKRSAKLTANQVSQIQHKRKYGWSKRELMYDYSISERCLNEVICGRYKVDPPT